MKGTVAAVIVVVAAIVAVVAGCSGYDKPDAGKIAVIRNGGPFDDKGIREVLNPNSGLSWVGAFSKKHEYPTSNVQRFYTITADPQAVGDKGGVDFVEVPTSDGIQVALEGTFFFTTAFDDSDKGRKLVQDFDEKFGVRTFALPNGERLHPWEGDAGWQGFLNAILRPIIDNELRVAIAKFRCEELVSSCALVVNRGDAQTIDTEAGTKNTFNLQAIQDEVEEGFTREVKAKLGDDYISNITFQLVRIKLPSNIQTAINEAQASFAAISKATALKEQAEQQRQAAEKLAAVYEKSPALAQIQMIRELKELQGGENAPKITVIVGGNVTPTLEAGQ